MGKKPVRTPPPEFRLVTFKSGEARTFAHQLQSASPAAKQGMQDEFVLRNMGLVRSVAYELRYRGEGAGMTIDDLIQEGVIGLLKALEKYDPDRGEFSTFAMIRIRQAMQYVTHGQSAKTGVSRPHYLSAHIMNVKRAKNRAEEELGRPPTAGEIYAAMRKIAVEREIKPLTLRQTKTALRYMDQRVDSLDLPSETGEPYLHERIPTEKLGPEHYASARSELTALERVLGHTKNALAKYDGTHADMFIRRLGLFDHQMETVQEIGERHGCAAEDVKRVEAKISRSLKHDVGFSGADLIIILRMREELTEILSTAPT